MILDLVWALVHLLISPLLLLPDVVQDVSQYSAIVSLMTSANRVVDIPLIFGVVGVMIGVMAATTPVALGLKIYKLIRG